MRFNRSRYVAVCQQLLATATVTAVAMTAAGVMTLDIVTPQNEAGSSAGVPLGSQGPAPAQDGGYVDSRPVTPKVRQVALAGPGSAQPARRGSTGPVARPRSGRVAARPEATAPVRVEGLRLALVSPPERVSGYATIGATWSPQVRLDEDQVAFQVRTSRAGDWSAWEDMDYHPDHAPDGGDSDASTGRPGTDATVVGDVDRVQVRVATASGRVPEGLRLSLVDPGADHLVAQAPAIDTARIPASDDTSTGAPVERTGGASAVGPNASGGGLSPSAMKVSPKPKIYSRAQWGANEKLRERGKPDYGTIKTGFVHHTVNTNHYSRKQVPAIIRGIYAYHVEGRGWRDIGYNFLVDRFGRIWEGRYGGVNRPVVGAHTLGYNDVSFAMSAIGNFDIYDHGRGVPPKVMLQAYARLFAWKLSRYGIRADASGLRIHGHRLHAINGHRDVGQTACPGRYLYAKLPTIRKQARGIQKRAQAAHSDPKPSAPPSTGPLRTPLAATAQPASIRFPRARNLSGSHWPDLVVTDKRGNLSLVRTGGVFGFRAGVLNRGWEGRTAVVATGDLTGDRHGDVVARTRGHRGWQVFAGDGHGHLGHAPYRARRLFTKMDQVIAVGDWNHDGRPDVMGRGAGGHHNLYLFAGRGRGRVAPRVRVARHWGRFTHTVLAGDLNRDHRADLVARGTDGRLHTILRTARGLREQSRRGRHLGQYDALLGSGDLDGDGRGDFLVRRRSDGSAQVYPGNGAGGFSHHLGPFGQLRRVRTPSAGDLGGDRRPDLVGITRAGNLKVNLNNGRTGIHDIRSAHWTVGRASAVYAVGDWNGDGRPDLVSRHASHGNQLRLNPGTGPGRFGAGVFMSNGWRGVSGLAAVGDVTGDGHPDMMGRDPRGRMLIFPGNGRHGFTRPRLAPATMRTFNQIGTGSWRAGAMPRSSVASRDGSFVAVAGGTDAARAMRAAGNGSLSQYDWVLGPGDVNGDGHADLVVRKRTNHTLWLVPGTGSGFGHRQFLTSAVGRYVLAG